ncbi:MAG: FAD-binding oxidoreductase [Deltaproteobacteria bacterium]|nr:FAD-binding oxidoreductase [Deltaproteobacteria bacterium]
MPLDACAERHADKVARIAAELRARPHGKPVSLKKSTPSHQVPKAGDLRRKDDKIDVSDLTTIIHVDPVRQLCIAEAGVTFCDLVEATLKHGLVPIVVPELKTITIGGAVSGCSIESMSFRYGGFHDTCTEYEVITASGDVITATPDNEHAMVFQMIHGSFGTLGVLAKLTFRLVPAKRFVKVVYEKYATIEDYQRAIFSHYQKQDIDFMDGIIHSPTEYVLSAGHFVDEAPYASKYDWVKVYYQSTAKRKEDYLYTQDYFFRYDRGVTNVHPKNPVLRFLFGKFIDSTQVLTIAEKASWLLKKEKPTIILDVFLPFSKMPEFLRWYEAEFKYFPLWCVPYKRVRNYEWLHDDFWKGLGDELFVDLAIYGMKQTGEKNYHKLMEEKLRELGGVKTLISHNYYTEQDFWAVWNKTNYSAAKAVTDPKNLFRDLYEKTCKAAMGMS